MQIRRIHPSNHALIGPLLGLAFALLLIPASSPAQTNPASQQPWVGDAPDPAPPLATGLSSRLAKRDVARVIRKVADWELQRAEPHFSQDWTFGALYTGFMVVPDAAGGSKFRAAMTRMGQQFHWQPGPRMEHADDQAVGQTYLDLYSRSHDAAQLTPIRERMDAELKLPDDPQHPLWWWCDALFMAPPVLAKLANITGNRAYLDFMDREWWITSDLLYDKQAHLYFRDKSFLQKHEANGKGLFWSRGNGWVMAGLVRVLAEMPADYPSRPKYVAQLREMAQEMAAIQSEDGLWRPGLLDVAAYKLPENSGSSFITYALAWGVNAGVLDEKTYRPVIARAWAGLVAHIYQDGRLGCIQPIGAAPGDYTPGASYVFGAGAFMLSSSEVYRLAR